MDRFLSLKAATDDCPDKNSAFVAFSNPSRTLTFLIKLMREISILSKLILYTIFSSFSLVSLLSLLSLLVSLFPFLLGIEVYERVNVRID